MSYYCSLFLTLFTATITSCSTSGHFREDRWTVETNEAEELSQQIIEIETFVAYTPLNGMWPKIRPNGNLLTEIELDTFLAAVRKIGGISTSAPSAIVQQGTLLTLSTSSIQKLEATSTEAELLSIETTATINDSESVDIRWKLNQLASPNAATPSMLATETLLVPLNSFAHVGGLIVYANGDKNPMELTVFTRVSHPSATPIR